MACLLRTHGIAVLFAVAACTPGERQKPPRAPRAVAVAPSALRLADAGRTRLVIRIPERLAPALPELAPSAPKAPAQRLSPVEKKAEKARQDLSASIEDLSRYLARMIGSDVPIELGEPSPADTRWPIFVAELAADRLGPVKGHSPGAQTFRVVATRDALGLYGESDLASSYAIYELLDRLGCRWYMPGALGEVVPLKPTLELAPLDEELTPSTLYRGVWYADADYKRRNRLGGVQLAAGHKLETWINAEQREQHPEWRAQIGGSFHESRLRWSNAQLADAIAASIDAQLTKEPADSASLSPGDGVDFDEGDDRALDAGDFDPTVNGVSLTDRLLVLANRVAERLEARHPETLLGLLAYASYTRPPVREQLHANVVPVIAPITYCRTRPWTDSVCPGADDVRRIVEGWSERARLLAFRGYVFNLAEPSAPNPMLRKWSEDMSFLLSHRMSFYQPETFPSFETNLPALYLGIRLSFSAQLQPSAVLDQLFREFYGSAALSVRAYSEFIDRAWQSSSDFAGGNLAYASRFPPDVLREARRLLELAKAACRAPAEQARVAMLDASLSQFERYMAMLSRLRTGELHNLATDYRSWVDEAAALAERYAVNSAFGKASWAGDVGIYASYFGRFLGPTLLEADRIAREQRLLTPQPICRFGYAKVDAQVAAAPPPATEASGPTTDVCMETWSRLGLHDYFGSLRYRASLEALPATSRPTYLWLSRVDGVVSVWVNGVAAHPVAGGSSAATPAEAHLAPLTFDVSRLLRTAKNELVIVVRRTRLTELGAGGLLGPVYLYTDK